MPGGNLPTLPVKRVVRPTPSIPDHEVVRQIGSGAYGEVWLAKSLTGAWRAVKIVWREDFEDERSFNREFEGILQYEPIARNHPGLVHILHVGRHDQDSPFYYYVMELGDDARTGVHITPDEYIPRTLQTDKKFSGNKPLPLDYCLEVGSQLAHALLYLHSKNLTHRDIKPANVIFVNGRPKLADIGLVAHLDQRSFVGTEGFIPPDGPGTRRADVYALAKVLYEISTGKDRMDFPELPDDLPEGTVRKKWQAFNTIICQAAEPRIEECSIDSAEELAEKIDALRGYEVPSRFRLQKKKKRRKLRRALQLLAAAAAGALTAYWGALWLNNSQHPPEEPASDIHPDIHSSAPEEESRTGYVLVTSSPAGASVYDADGNYLDETPYGPIELPSGSPVAYTIKKSGFADKEEAGTVKGGATLALGRAEGVPSPYGQPALEGYGGCYVPARRNAPCGARPPYRRPVQQISEGGPPERELPDEKGTDGTGASGERCGPAHAGRHHGLPGVAEQEMRAGGAAGQGIFHQCGSASAGFRQHGKPQCLRPERHPRVPGAHYRHHQSAGSQRFFQ